MEEDITFFIAEYQIRMIHNSNFYVKNQNNDNSLSEFINFIENQNKLKIFPNPVKEACIDINEFNSISSIYSNIDDNISNNNINAFSIKNEYQIYLKQRNHKIFFPKFTKKDTIDKKILRSFRRFIINKYKNNELNYPTSDRSFLKKFCTQYLLPSFEYKENNGEILNFRSYSGFYYYWLFSQKGFIGLYRYFISISGETLLNCFVHDYSLDTTNSDYVQLKDYIINMPTFYVDSYKTTSTDNDISEILFDDATGNNKCPQIEKDQNSIFSFYLDNKPFQKRKDSNESIKSLSDHSIKQLDSGCNMNVKDYNEKFINVGVNKTYFEEKDEMHED